MKSDKTSDNSQPYDEDYSLDDLGTSDKISFGIDVTKKVILKLLLYIFVALFLVGSLGAGVITGYFANLVAQTNPPSKEEMVEKISKVDQLSTLLYADGSAIANVQSDVVRTNTQLSDISPYIINGLIATEDEYFYEHEGVVPKAIVRAALQEVFTSGQGTGGSTLTQQLVKQQLLTHDVTFSRKANEILLALRLENYVSKDDILTAYLNVSPFGRNHLGENVAGIATASEGIFGVKPSEVTLPQAAFLVGLPQNPYIYTPYLQNGVLNDDLQPGINRMKEVLFRMYRMQYIDKEEYEEALAYDITQDFLAPSISDQNHQSYLYQAMTQNAIEKLMEISIENDGYTWTEVYADDEWYNDYYKEAARQVRTGGYQIQTTIDRSIYDQLQRSAQSYVGELGVAYEGVHTDEETGEEVYYKEEVQNGMVVIDNPTGRVLGFVAGTNYNENQIDHAFSVRRSPGSTIKPLAVYGPAVEEDIISPATVIPDTAFIQEYEDGSTWAPTNYGMTMSNDFMTARTALARSDNLPAVRIYEEMQNQGVDILDYLSRMGFNTQASYSQEDVDNLAFSLGGVTTGPTVFEETRAFTTFANNGQYLDGYTIEKIVDSQGEVVYEHQAEPVEVFSEDSNYIMVDMLRDTMVEGTGRIARGYMEMEGDWIAKTGISEDSKDVWILASTPQITIGSWIGYDSKYENYAIDVNDGYGLESERSQLYFARVINELYNAHPKIFGTDMKFSQPESVVEVDVLEPTGTLPGNMTYNGHQLTLSGPLKRELFKRSKNAPKLTYDFMVGASEEETNRFWQELIGRMQEQRRRQQESQPSRQQSSQESNRETPGQQDEQLATPPTTEQPHAADPSVPQAPE